MNSVRSNTVGIISLGCAKNRVDTEELLGYLKAYGFEIVNDVRRAKTIIVNTCGFILPAKEESVNTIIEMIQYKQSGTCEILAVTGCLSQRYPEELREELPEVDIFWGVREYQSFAKKLAQIRGLVKKDIFETDRILTTPRHLAYLRISDGCGNRCAYCAIPLIRGSMRSIPKETVISEAKRLVEEGIKELIVIAQDTTAYGSDIYGKPSLLPLLKEISGIKGDFKIRLLYTYPEYVTRELIDFIASETKMMKYIDMPIQHISDDILKRMNRRGSASQIKEIITYAKKICAEFVLRSTIIVGFPGETEAQFEELLDFVSEARIDKLGAFAFSPEDDTAACSMPDQIDEEVKKHRLDKLMELQRGISSELMRKRVGQKEKVIIDYIKDGYCYCRSYKEAPDVDGYIVAPFKDGAESGDYVFALIKKSFEYDLEGELL